MPALSEFFQVSSLNVENFTDRVVHVLLFISPLHKLQFMVSPEAPARDKNMTKLVTVVSYSVMNKALR